MKKPLGLQSNLAFIFAYFLVWLLLAYMAWPFLNTLVFGAMLSASFYPLRSYLVNHWNFRPWQAAVVTLMVIVLTLFLPAIYLIIGLSEEAVNLFNYLKLNLTEEAIEQILFGEGLFGNAWLPKLMEDLFAAFNLQYNVTTIQGLILDSASLTSSYLLDLVNEWLGNILGFLMDILIMFVVIYSILAEGERFMEFFHRVSPLPREEVNIMVSRFTQMNYATLVANGIGGLIQGGLAGAAFWLAGFESLLLWTSTMVVLAFIPLVGMSLVFIPASIVLMARGQISEGLALLGFCSLVAIWVEQWFKAKFVGNRAQINSILVFFAIVGGMTQFGFLGIFYGPLIVSMFLTLVELYHKRFSALDPTDGDPIRHPFGTKRLG